MKRKLYVNSSVCIGCQNCMAACSMHHFKYSGMAGLGLDIELDPFSGNHKIIICRQCDPAGCADACPEDAIERIDTTGALVINKSKCIECGACVDACPFRAMKWREKDNMPFKCDLCAGEPSCVSACHFAALFFVEQQSEVPEGIPSYDIEPLLGRGES